MSEMSSTCVLFWALTGSHLLGALEKCQWLLFRKTIFKGIANTDVHLQLSFLGKMEMEWTWEIPGRRFMVFAISRKHRNEVGGIQKRAKAFVLTPYQ